jgi:hypothetical protein
MVEMHDPVPWVNKLLFPPDVKDKRNELKILTHLSALVKRVAELYEAGLKACHCTKDFYLRRIRPHGRWQTLAYECPWLNDPSRDLDDGEIFSVTPSHI